MKSYIPLDWLLDYVGKAFPPEDQTQIRDALDSAPHVDLPEDGILSVRSALGRFDEVETYSDCTVQVLRCSDTGDISLGWWRNDSPPFSL